MFTLQDVTRLSDVIRERGKEWAAGLYQGGFAGLTDSLLGGRWNKSEP